MRVLLDTSVAINVRDGDERLTAKIGELTSYPLLSVISRVELEGGIYRDPQQAGLRRARLDSFLPDVDEVPFTNAEALIYGKIVAEQGYSRSLVLDRMIAAQALVAGAALATLNPRDFRDVHGLQVLDWTA